jgi:hypothetical protein
LRSKLAALKAARSLAEKRTRSGEPGAGNGHDSALLGDFRNARQQLARVGSTVKQSLCASAAPRTHRAPQGVIGNQLAKRLA